MCRHISRRDTSWKIEPVLRHDIVGADARQLTQLGVGAVGGEGVEHRLRRVRHRQVQDDHARVDQAVVVDAVVAPRVAAHVALAVGPEGDPPLADRGGAAVAALRAVRATASTARAWRVAAGARQRPPGQLDHERARAGKVGVLPARRDARQEPDPARGQPGAARVARAPAPGRRLSCSRPAAAPGGTRSSRPGARGARAGAPPATPAPRAASGPSGRCAASGGGSCGSGRLRVRSPASRPATPSGLTVRTVQIRMPPGRAQRTQPPDHRVAGGLVAVDGAHHQHPQRRVAGPGDAHLDRPALHRPADALGAGFAGAEDERRDRRAQDRVSRTSCSPRSRSTSRTSRTNLRSRRNG